MPRQKKDGRHINYYIDRKVFEELESYAQEKGQTMTTALERILSQFLSSAGKKIIQTKIDRSRHLRSTSWIISCRI